MSWSLIRENGSTYVDIVVFGKVHGDVQREAGELGLEGLLEGVLLVLLITVPGQPIEIREELISFELTRRATR